MFNFEKLETWQAAIQFADMVYELTRNFPDQERFGLTNQTRLYTAAEKQGRMLSGLRNSLLGA